MSSMKGDEHVEHFPFEPSGDEILVWSTRGMEISLKWCRLVD